MEQQAGMGIQMALIGMNCNIQVTSAILMVRGKLARNRQRLWPMNMV